MLRNTSRWMSLFVVILAAAWATPSYAISKDFNQTYPLKSDGSFELQNVNGTVDVQGWDRDEVEVRAVKTAKQRESDLDRVSIDVDAKPGAVSISTHYPQNEGVEVVVEYKIRVPQRQRTSGDGSFPRDVWRQRGNDERLSRGRNSCGHAGRPRGTLPQR